ncbi:hypothetical protein C8J56DRAFT_778146 [Mycena floridula]|nr:hypothetical protein C8J56DRAFT_778146 [Mycena floridula]
MTSSPSACLNNSTLNGLVSCLDNFTIGPDTFNSSTYQAAQPTTVQVLEWTSLVTSMLSMTKRDSGDCKVTLPHSLQGIYSVSEFYDEDDGTKFCVLFEKTVSTVSDATVYAKGWGTMIVPASRRAVSRSLHLSAPHPLFDLNTPQQAAALFQRTGATSFLVSGRIRTAFLEATNCIIPSDPDTTYYRTDPAHDDHEPFNIANRAIRAWQDLNNGGCPSETCAYIQIHGKGASSCPLDTMFISSGLGNSALSSEWYQNEPNLPSRRLKGVLETVFPTWNATLPSDDTSCDLTATTNVFGRLINSIPEVDVCTVAATALLATGQFIHIEQAAISRQAAAYDAWGLALRQTFGTSCARGMHPDTDTGLCI